MIELVDTLPDINVQPAEYKRLLGYPREAVLGERARELADWARAWYAQNGRPWVYAREVESFKIDESSIVIEGKNFTSKRLHRTLKEADAHGVIIVAVGAGPEIEAAAQQAWLEEKPDEYFFLEIYGSAIVEHLTTMIGARLCAWGEGHKMAVLPHYSPGYPEWDISQQPWLMELIRTGGKQALPAKIEVMDSGMLRPKKSLLAVFGLTHHMERVRRLTDLVPCENCSYGACQYRRVPYARAPEHSKTEASAGVTGGAGGGGKRVELAQLGVQLERDAKYGVNGKALRRWTDERLSLDVLADGTVQAMFRYEGSTCKNTGRTIRFHYNVKLGTREEGYPIREQKCGPAPGDEGHTFMCRYMSNAEHLMVAIDHEKPLLGQPLNDVLKWPRPAVAATCYCEPGARKHKWGLVLETIHYALVEREKQLVEGTGEERLDAEVRI